MTRLLDCWWTSIMGVTSRCSWKWLPYATEGAKYLWLAEPRMATNSCSSEILMYLLRLLTRSVPLEMEQASNYWYRHGNIDFMSTVLSQTWMPIIWYIWSFDELTIGINLCPFSKPLGRLQTCADRALEVFRPMPHEIWCCFSFRSIMQVMRHKFWLIIAFCWAYCMTCAGPLHWDSGEFISSRYFVHWITE